MRYGLSDPFLQDVLAGTAAATCLGGLISLLYWLFTGLSPWPMVILGEVVGLGFGIALLALASPRRRR